MNNWITFIEVEGFYVEVYRRLCPLLGGKPLVVARSNQVLDACGRANAGGVNIGTPLRQVWCLCPQAEIVSFSRDDCLPLYRQIWNIVAAHSPVVEPTDLHRGFADVTKMATDIHQAQAWRKQVSEQIQRQTGLGTRIGVGPDKFAAQVAATGDVVVAGAEVAEFLAPILLSGCDWLDSDVVRALVQLGLTTLGQVAEVDRNALIQQVGIAGGRLHDWVNGKDARPVQPLYPPHEERIAHDFDIEDRQEVIIRVLSELCEELAGKLQSVGSQAGRLTLRVEDVTRPRMLTQQYSRPLQEVGHLYGAAQRLLRQLWQGEPLLQMEIVAEGLLPVERGQLSLWGSRNRHQIEQAVEAARSRYGIRAVSKASELDDERRFAQMILAAEGRFSW